MRAETESLEGQVDSLAKAMRFNARVAFFLLLSDRKDRILVVRNLWRVKRVFVRSMPTPTAAVLEHRWLAWSTIGAGSAANIDRTNGLIATKNWLRCEPRSLIGRELTKGWGFERTDCIWLRAECSLHASVAFIAGFVSSPGNVVLISCPIRVDADRDNYAVSMRIDCFLTSAFVSLIRPQKRLFSGNRRAHSMRSALLRLPWSVIIVRVAKDKAVVEYSPRTNAGELNFWALCSTWPCDR